MAAGRPGSIVFALLALVGYAAAAASLLAAGPARPASETQAFAPPQTTISP